MGYTTYMSGEFYVDPPLPKKLIERFQREFGDSKIPGEEGWPSWQISDDGATIYTWDESVKHYYWESHLSYLLRTIDAETSCKVNGDVSWDGEETDDIGLIRVIDNVLSIVHTGDLLNSPIAEIYCEIEQAYKNRGSKNNTIYNIQQIVEKLGIEQTSNKDELLDIIAICLHIIKKGQNNGKASSSK